MDFVGYGKIARLSREIIITEKIDGTNAQVYIADDGTMLAGSRTRWIEPGKNDNYGFAGWVEANREELLKLGPGHHFGEWWGRGINRGYGLDEKRFSLFNVSLREKPELILPSVVGFVPVLWRGIFNTEEVDRQLSDLERSGSMAAPGFMRPEGVVVFHVAGNVGFKKTIGDDGAKSR